jgi:hypothetical protein
MKRIYEAEVYFDYPVRFYGERRTDTYLVEAGSMRAAVRLVSKVARRNRNGGYAPRIQLIKEHGVLVL